MVIVLVFIGLILTIEIINLIKKYKQKDIILEKNNIVTTDHIDFSVIRDVYDLTSNGTYVIKKVPRKYIKTAIIPYGNEWESCKDVYIPTGIMPVKIKGEKQGEWLCYFYCELLKYRKFRYKILGISKIHVPWLLVGYVVKKDDIRGKELAEKYIQELKENKERD